VQLNGHVVESAVGCGERDVGDGITMQATADRAQILGPGIVRGYQTGCGGRRRRASAAA
jgi:hypothetical protein